MPICAGAWYDDGARVFVRDYVAEAVKRTLDGGGIDIPFLRRVVELHGDAV
jgi:hypothetical protein